MKKEIITLVCFILLLVSCAPEERRMIDPANVTIGYIGCSNTRETVEGYHYTGGTKMWPYERRYGSGTVRDWANDVETGSVYWEVFDELMQEYPHTKVIWWQLCIPDNTNERSTALEHTEIILQQVRKRIPNVVLYVSPLADYTEGVCSITGTWGLEKAKELAQEVDEHNDDVIAGPILGPMTPADTAKDGCHLSSPDGKRKLGNQMREFFDAQQNMNEDSIQNSIENVTVRDNVTISEEVASLPEQKPLTFEEKGWKQRIDKAMAPTLCPPIENQEYPENYYQGPLIDTHLHLPAIPDSMPEEGEDEEENYNPEENEEGAFGGPQAILGENVKMSEIACTLQREGTMKNFAFFPVYPEIYLQAIEIANKTMTQYPDLFTSFIMPPTEDTPTVEAKVLRKMLRVYPHLFQGYGEVGSSPTEEKNPPPDDPLYLENYKLARQYHLLVYYHPGWNQVDNWERVLEQHPDIQFIVHAEELEEDIDDLMTKFPNIYYTANSDFNPHFQLYVGKSKEEFLNAVERDFDALIEKDLQRWKRLIEKHPDRFMWGTDRGDAVWNYDVEVGLFLVKYGRAFIGRLDPAVQEKFAYGNAERLVNAERVVDETKVVEETKKSIGYMGCSITVQAVEGHQQDSGMEMWLPDQGFDDGSVMNWAGFENPENRWWKAFDKNLEKYPETKAIWWQLCIPAHENPTYEIANSVIDALRTRLPQVTIYVSSLAPYAHLCEGSGPTGVERGKRLAEELASRRADVKLGPTFSVLTLSDTENDKCHLNDLGKQKMGEELNHFLAQE